MLLSRTKLLLLFGLFISSALNAQISFVEDTTVPFTDVTYGDSAWADVDGDGDLDVLITGKNSAMLPVANLYINDGVGGFTLDSTAPFVPVHLSSIAFADVDGDNDLDVLITGNTDTIFPATASSRLYLNNGLGQFTYVAGTPFDDVSNSAIAFADVDGDNDQDLVITGVNPILGRISKLYINDGIGGFNEDLVTSLIGIQDGAVGFADIDGDNDQDLLISGHKSFQYGVELYTNDGAGSFTTVIGTPFFALNFSSISFADIDGDNDNDVLMTGHRYAGAGVMAVTYKNDGLGNYSLAETLWPGVYYSDSAFADVDNDGDLDLVVSGWSSGSGARSELFINDGFGNFTRDLSNFFENLSQSAIAFADVNNDGDQDLLVTGYGLGAYTTKLYRNCNLLSISAVATDASCLGSLDGSAEVTVNFNTPTAIEYSLDAVNWVPLGMPTTNPYTFQINNLTNAVYSLTVREIGENSCNENTSFTVNAPSNPFITTWRTTTANETIIIPTTNSTGEIYNYNVDWGDGNTTMGATANATHVYAIAGDHQITITGTFPRFRASGGNPTNTQKIISIDQWGCNPWETMDKAFQSCGNLVINATDTPNLSNATDITQMFLNCPSLGGGTGNWDWDMSTITTMLNMFGQTLNFNKDISSWDTSNVVDMSFVFQFSGFNQNINTWDTSNVTTMVAMFNSATNFNQPLDNWDTSSVTDMRSMFSSAFAFDQDIGNWDTSSVTVFNGTFAYASFNQDIGNWDTSSAIDINAMFYNATAFDQDLGNWNVENVTNAGSMFNNVTLSTSNYDSLLIGWNSQNLNPSVSFSGGYSQYCAGEAARANMIATDLWSISDGGFAGSTVDDLPDQTASGSYTLPVITGTNLTGNEAYYTGPNGTGTQYVAGDVINFADFTSYPINLYIYDNVSVGCESEESFELTLDDGCLFITTWETTVANESITIPTIGTGYNYNVDWGDGNTTAGATGDTSHAYAAAGLYQVTITGAFPRIMFNTSASAQNIISIDQWGCNPWISMSDAFYLCTNLVVNATDTPNLSNVTSMFQMFVGATSLGGGTGNWDWSTGNILNMERVFNNATSFNQDISSWATNSVTTMKDMFNGATVFNQPIINWDTSSVINMRSTFQGASSFNQDIGAWNTSNVVNMEAVFTNAIAFDQDIGNWDTSNVTFFTSMFYGANIFNQDIGNWDTSNASKMEHMFGGATSFDQDLGSWNVENVTHAFGMFDAVTLSISNYDSLLIGWNAQILNSNVLFSGGFSQYCAGEAARANMIASDNWDITDGGFAGSTVNDLPNQTASMSFTLPVISGTNLSGSEAYYTDPNGTGTMYNAGDVINYADFPSYPITLYIFDSVSDGCISEENFELTITIPPPCTSLSEPLVGSIDVIISIDLTWNAVSEATGYYLTVGTTSGGTEILNAFDVGNVLTYDLATDLPENAVIYVSVIPYNADGDAIGCTEESFTTEDLLFPPDCTTLNSPTSGSTDVLVDSYLSWDAAPNATGYMVTVGTTSGGTEILNTFDVGNILTYNLATDLPENTVIYVSIIPYNADGDAIGCTEESFTTEDLLFPPDCTTLSDPLAGAINVPIDTDFNWNAVANATGYRINIGTNSIFFGEFDVGNALTYDLAFDLPENTEIYVRIIPYNLDGDAIGGCTSEIFTTGDDLMPPTCTTLSSPVSGATNVIVSTDLTWNAIAEATGYTLTVGTTSGGTDILNAIDVGNVLTYDLTTDLPENSVIYVSVIPYNADGDAIGCSEESFTTEDLLFPPDCTTLNSPTSGSVNVLVGTDLTWNSIADATGYILSVGTTSGGSDTLNNIDVGNVITYDLATDLPDSTVIYVSVIPYNSDGEATGCSEESFTTEDLLFLPNCTALFSSTSGSTDVLIGTDLIWDIVPEATGYVLTVGTTSGGADILNALDVGNSLSYDLAYNLPVDTIIYITIIPYNEDGDAVGCTEESFTTQSASDRIPNFFTPNGDNVNDNWVVPNESNDISEIIIFNRYGKILDKISNSSTGWGWNGTYNGVMLPSSDYWYLIQYINGKVLKGHFSLKR